MLPQDGKRSDWITGINVIMPQNPRLSSAVVNLFYSLLSSIDFSGRLYDERSSAGVLMALLLLLKPSDSLASKK